MVGLTAETCSDREAIDLLLDPARNPYRRETLNIGVHSPAISGRCSTPISLSPRKSATPPTARTSAIAWSPARARCSTLADTRDPDVVIPMLIAADSRAREVYQRAMGDAWSAKNELLDRRRLFRRN